MIRWYLSLIVEKATDCRNIGYPQHRNCEVMDHSSIGDVAFLDGTRQKTPVNGYLY